MTELLFLISIPVIIALIFMQSFKHCSSSQILVISNKNKLSPQRKIVPPNEFTFVNPLSQKYAYIELFEAYPFELCDNFFEENEYAETYDCLVGLCEGEQYYETFAQNLAGLDRNGIIEIAKNIIGKELKEIAREVKYTDFYDLKNYEKYKKQINEKLNKVGLQLSDI